MAPANLTRRRMIAIAAATAGSAFLSGGRRAWAGEAVRWRGSALGAQVSIDIFHPDREEAERIVQVCLAEVRRLERQFSLYRADSAICALNRSGILVAPEPDMVALLKASLQFSDLTDGAFDPTVQPLWQLYAEHFSSEKPDPDGPPAERLTEALAKVGRSGLRVSEERVALLRHGAAITLNGIAQGYATDRVVDVLRARGLSTTLVNMGEIRALGARADGTPWRVGLADPDKPGALTETVDLVDRAVATTAGAGFRFDPAGRFTHLFDPRTGRSPALYRTVSVIAPTATEADALSTAFSLMPASRIGDIAAARPGVQVRLITGRWRFARLRHLRDRSFRQPEHVGRASEGSQRFAPGTGERRKGRMRMRGFMFVALLAVACSGEVRAQDAAAGEKVFGVCKTCHQIGENAKNGVGPVLNGLIGRKSGSVPGYSYSAANKDSGITWDEADVPRIHQGSEGENTRAPR